MSSYASALPSTNLPFIFLTQIIQFHSNFLLVQNRIDDTDDSFIYLFLSNNKKMAETK